MAKQSFNPNAEIKLQLAQWKAITGGTQYEIARSLGISPSQLSQILSGTRPGVRYVDRITQLIAS